MNAVIYARYSTGHDQTERSIEGQLEDCYKYAAANDINIIGEYIDRKISGTGDNRHDFQRMIKDSASRQFDIVLVWKLDRFARNRYDSANYRAKLKANGVRLTSVMEAIPDSPEGIMLEALLEGIAEYYSKELSVKIKRGIRVARSKGEYTGGQVLFGYHLKDKKIYIDEQESKWIRFLFEKYADGVPLRTIIAEINEKSGLKPRRGTQFHERSFQNALRNSKYLGNEIYPPLLDLDLFNRVQAKINARKQAPAAEKARVKYQLQGKIFCGHCGSSMIGESGKGKHSIIYHYYKCFSRKKMHDCAKKNERKEFIEQYVVQQTLQHLLTDDMIDKIADLMEQEYRKEFDASGIGALERRIANIDHEIDEHIQSLIAFRDNKKIVDRITAKIDELEDQKECLDHDLSSLRIAVSVAFDAKAFKSWMHFLKQGDSTDEEFRQIIIDTFINAVYLYDDKIVICYNSSGDSDQISFSEMSEELDHLESSRSCSDFAQCAPPIFAKSELIIFSHKHFAAIFYRE